MLNMTPDPTNTDYALDDEGNLYHKTIITWAGLNLDVGYLPAAKT